MQAPLHADPWDCRFVIRSRLQALPSGRSACRTAGVRAAEAKSGGRGRQRPLPGRALHRSAPPLPGPPRARPAVLHLRQSGECAIRTAGAHCECPHPAGLDRDGVNGRVGSCTASRRAVQRQRPSGRRQIVLQLRGFGMSALLPSMSSAANQRSPSRGSSSAGAANFLRAHGITCHH